MITLYERRQARRDRELAAARARDSALALENERLRLKIAELLDAPDWGEQMLAEADGRRLQGERAHKWKQRAEALERELNDALARERYWQAQYLQVANPGLAP